MNKQQQIEKLENRLANVENIYNDQKELLNAMKELLDIPSHSGNDRVLVTFRKVLEDARFFSKKLGEMEGTVNERVHALTAENARLWYMLRAITGDATLKNNSNEESNYKDYSTNRDTPFDGANF